MILQKRSWATFIILDAICFCDSSHVTIPQLFARAPYFSPSFSFSYHMFTNLLASTRHYRTNKNVFSDFSSLYALLHSWVTPGL